MAVLYLSRFLGSLSFEQTSFWANNEVGTTTAPPELLFLFIVVVLLIYDHSEVLWL
jgi:hypothetical protein